MNDRMDLWLADQEQYLDADTISSYRALYDKHMRDTLGRRKLKNVSHTDLKRLYAGMVETKGLSVQTAQALNACVAQMLEEAVNDDLLRKNPAKGATAKLSTKHKGEKAHKDALTAKQQELLLAFVAASTRFRRFLNMLVVLFGTGMRIAEVCGLARSECNFRQSRIHVRRQLRYRPDKDGHYQYKLKEHTKTSAGNRDIPAFSSVRRALMDEVAKSRKVKNEFSIRPYAQISKKGKETEQELDKPVSGFIFLNEAGKPFTPPHVYAIIQDIVKAYNEEESAKAKAEGRRPELLPKMGPHSCRHSFASRLHEAHVDPLIIKAVMGHEDYRTSANTYIDVPFEQTKEGLDVASEEMHLVG